MVGQYLPQTNESVRVAKSKKFSDLNKALVENEERINVVG